MEQQQERPPAYADHDPTTLEFPSVPRQEPPAAVNGVHLPELGALGRPNSRSHDANTNAITYSRHGADSQQWLPLSQTRTAMFPVAPSTPIRNGTEMEITSPADAESVMSYEDALQHQNHVATRDDPDVLMAAEALSDLGNPDLARSPSNRSITLPPFSPSNGHRRIPSDEQQNQDEPLFPLILGAHPWIGGTVNGSLNAYSATMAYSPRFVQAGAAFVERNIGSPLANTVGAVGRRTGVEERLRHYYGSQRRPSDIERGDQEEFRHMNGIKRRRTASPDGDAMEIDREVHDTGPRVVRPRNDSSNSLSSLPGYDANCSPPYEEAVRSSERPESRDSQGSRSMHWSRQLIYSTSGLGVAMSNQSLRSLRHCLHILHTSTRHMNTYIRALRMLVEDYQRTISRQRQINRTNSHDHAMTNRQTDDDAQRDAEARKIADEIKKYCGDIKKTIKDANTAFNQYARGKIPANAEQLVRKHLDYFQRFAWRRAFPPRQQQEPSGETDVVVRAANGMLTFAKEGLVMMDQVTVVIDLTVQSAETWLSRIGRNPRAEPSGSSTHDEKRQETLPLTNGEVKSEKQ